MVLDEGSVKELSAAPPPSWDRVPVTEANRQGIVDPLTAMLFSAAVTGEGLSQEACQHTLPSSIATRATISARALSRVAFPALKFKRGRRHKQVPLRFCSGEESRIAPIHKETRQ